MVFARFLKPKWQHPDPEVRRQSIKSMSSTDGEVLARIAREDQVAGIRSLALRRIGDLELLYQAMQEDQDKSVRELAGTRLCELLAGKHAEAPPDTERETFLEQKQDARLLEYVALQGVEPGLRRQAQERVSRETVLRDVAIGDEVLANREAALARINQVPVLEAVLRETRKRDKKIHRQSRDRLNTIKEAEERPARVQAEAEALCARLEAWIKEAHWLEGLQELDALKQRWGAIVDEVTPQLSSRYQELYQRFTSGAEQCRVDREEEQKRWSENRQARTLILGELAQCQRILEQRDSLSAEEQADYTAALEGWRERWSQLDDLPVEESDTTPGQFNIACDAVGEQLRRLREIREATEQLGELCERSEQLQKSKKPIKESQVKALEAGWKKQQWPQGSAPVDTRLALLVDMDRQLRDRLAKQREQRQLELERLPERLDQLEACLEGQMLKEALPLHDRIKSSLDRLQALGVKRQQLQTANQRLGRMTPRLRELQSWRSWGADEARERLCNEMEALIESALEPMELASEIRRLRNKWNQARSDGGKGFKTLRKRFDQAASEAYKPCEIYFKQRATEQERNLESRRELLARLEEYLAATDWTPGNPSAADWKIHVKFQRQISNEWRQASPVDARKSRQVNSDYRRLQSQLNEQLESERKRNLAQREALIEQVAALAEMEEVGEAIETCKQLQARWQTTVAGKRQQENALWERFREACDAVFDRRKQQHQARQAHEQENAQEKQRICEQIEALSKTSTAQLAEAERSMERLLGQWQSLGAVPKSKQRELQQRLDLAQRAFRAHADGLRKAEVEEEMELLGRKAGICDALEERLEDPQAGGSDNGSSPDQQWSDLPPLRDATLEAAIQQRHQAVNEALQEPATSQQPLIDRLTANLAKRQELCLRMEILAGVESPPEAQQARLAYQANRLAEAMGQGVRDPVGEMAEIVREWYLSGSLPIAETRALQSRFEQARRSGPSGE